MENITSQLKDMISSQLSGNPDARSNALKGLRDVKENNEEGNKRNSPQDYLKDSNGLKIKGQGPQYFFQNSWLGVLNVVKCYICLCYFIHNIFENFPFTLFPLKHLCAILK